VAPRRANRPYPLDLLANLNKRRNHELILPVGEMPTTELFAEILLVGLLALPWVAIANASFVRASGISDFHGGEAVVTAVVLALAYAIGIVLDRVADALFEPWDEAISRKVRSVSGLPGESTLSRPSVRFRVMAAAPDSIVRFLDYARSRRRVLRGVVLNSVLLTLVALGDVVLHHSSSPSNVSERLDWTLASAGTVFCGFALFSWWHIGRMYFQRSLTAYKLFVLKEPAEPSTS
jgi:hypothetical protein